MNLEGDTTNGETNGVVKITIKEVYKELIGFRDETRDRLVKIETAASVAKDLATVRAQDNNLFWVKAGVYAALLMGAGSMITLWLISIH